jgi:hypothetical protein
MEQRTDWPFGPALEQRRVAAGLSVKAAARRTHGQVSDGRWYQLESGYQQIKGQHIPIGTKPATVAAVAQAVNWDVSEALRTAGFEPRDYQPPREDLPLKDIPTEELMAQIERLWAELRRRRPMPEPLEDYRTARRLVAAIPPAQRFAT